MKEKLMLSIETGLGMLERLAWLMLGMAFGARAMGPRAELWSGLVGLALVCFLIATIGSFVLGRFEREEV